MSGTQGSSNTASKSNPETASVVSYSSTSGLLKNNNGPKPTPIDTKKLQEQALKSQIRFCM